MSHEEEIRRIYERYERRAQRCDSGRYSYLNPSYVAMVQEREREFLRILARHWAADRLSECTVLEIGCGSGALLCDLVKYGFRPELVHGMDLLESAVDDARRKNPRFVLSVGDASRCGYPGAFFDLVVANTVFSSILDFAVRAALAGEMLRVLKPAGVIVIYDFHVDNPANPDVKAVTGAELKRLFPGTRQRSRRVTLAPPIARAVAGWSYGLLCLLERVPLLRTHTITEVTRT